MKCIAFKIILILLLCLISMDKLSAISHEQQLTMLAQNYYQLSLNNSQPIAYYYDFKLTRHNQFLSNSPESLSQFNTAEDLIHNQLKQIDHSKLATTQAKVFYAKFNESIEASIEQRICKTELWNLNHMSGPHLILDFLINVQPVETEQNKKDALQRWSAAADYYKQEIKNLNQGLKDGYSAPQRVVKRLLQQLNNLTTIPISEHPFMQLADRSDDIQFKQNFKKIIEEELLPSLKTFSSYLEITYIPAARSELGLHAIPDGRACYIALYRSYTTLQRTPEQVFDTGLKAVNENIKNVTALGKKLYGTATFEEAVKKASTDKSQKFNNSQQMHEFYLDVVARSKSAMINYFYKLPSIEMEVEAIPEYQQGSGRSAHYNQGNNERTAKFRYDPTNYPLENYGSAEIVSVHEGYPGHHMQIALVQDLQPFHPVEHLFSNSAFAEGWARYAESLAEEAGIYQSKSAKITRRTWPARGMVADTAMHLLGWSNEAVSKFLADSGKSFAKAPDVMMDRMAALPAQLTAYDSGALEIFALRKKVEQAQGKDFDIKQFHQIILNNGNVPLAVLRQQIDSFIAGIE